MADAQVKLDLKDEAATLALGRRLATMVSRGDVVTLSGELGAGKTTLARGLIRGLAERAGLAPEEVPSPSFPVVQVYELGPLNLWHFDLYRIERAAELEELGLADALGDAVVLIEWPDRVQALLPQERLDIRLEWAGEGRLGFLAGRLQSSDGAALRELL